MAGNSKRVFPGGNTSKGFFNYFNYMIPRDVNRIFSIKGGPGVGKSSLMKKIANEFMELGYDVEMHHCSSDPRSLDGLVIPELKVVLLDGTAPHIVDPKNPGAEDEIINLGEHWNLEELEKNKDGIKSCGREISRYFTRAYKFLEAAAAIYRDIEDTHKSAMDFGKVNSLTNKLIDEILIGVEQKDKNIEVRHLFGSAYTPLGYIECTDSVLKDVKNIYYIDGEIGTGKTTLLNKLYNRASDYGLEVEVYHSPLVPEKIETVLIKDLDLALTTSKLFKENSEKTIDLNEFIDKEKCAKYREELDYDIETLNELVNYALLNIKRAKSLHDDLEEYYVPNMRFDEIENVKDELVNRILSYKK